jgi:hypothetical protein
VSFEEAGREVIAGLKAGLYQAGIDIMYVSQAEVPVDTGTLRASGRVLEPEELGDTVSITIGYGYGDQVNPKTGQLASQYAVPVHERLDVKHAPPTKAKFLEDPVRAYQSLYGETIQAWVQAWTRGTSGNLLGYLRAIRPSGVAESLASNMSAAAGGDARRAAIAETSRILAGLRGEG